MNINEKISFFVENQFSEFFRREGENLVNFITTYYEWLDSEGNINNETAKLLLNQDIDHTESKYLDFFKNTFMKDIPSTIKVDERFLIKNISSFYKTKGSEESFRILFRLLFDEEIGFYYPGDDIFKSSDGNWIIDKSIKINTQRLFTEINSKNYIYGELSKASARIDRYEEIGKNSIFIKELFITDIVGTFIVGEKINDETGAFLGTVTKSLKVYPGRFYNTDGFLSEDKYLQDNDYYQEYSYEIISSKSKNVYEDTVNKLTHPAGTKLFGRVVQESEWTLTNVIYNEIDIILESSIDSNLQVDTLNTLSLDVYGNALSNNNADFSYLLTSLDDTNSLLYQSVNVSGGQVYTLSLDVYPGDQNIITVSEESWGSPYYASFDSSDGTLISSEGVETTWMLLDDNYYRLSVTFIVPNGYTVMTPKVYPGQYRMPLPISTRSVITSVTPTITASSAYTANNLVGGLMTFTNALDTTNYSGLLQSITLTINSIQTAFFKLWLFNDIPSNTTWTDKTAPSINSADISKLIGVYTLNIKDTGLGSETIYDSDIIGEVISTTSSTSLYGVLQTIGTPIFSNTNDVTVCLGIIKD